MASTSGAPMRSRWPSRTTPSTMSRRCRGDPPTSVCSTSRSAMANPASGVSRSSIISTTLGVVVATPSSRPAVSEETTTESAPDCLQQVLVLGLSDRRHDLGLGRDLPGGQRDQHRGVVATGGDDDRRRVLGPRPAAARRTLVASPCTVTRPAARGVFEGATFGVDDDDVAAGRLVAEDRGDRRFALGAVADDDGVVAHSAPPTLDLPCLPGPLGEHLERRADQHDQERDPQRGEDHDVDQPRGFGVRGDVAVAESSTATPSRSRGSPGTTAGSPRRRVSVAVRGRR